MRLSIFFAALALAASPAAADPAADIRAANARWTQAIAGKDMATVEALVAPDFRLTSGTAKPSEVTPRDRWMANLAKMNIAYYRTEITDLELHGDTAIATVAGSWDMSLGDFKKKTDFRLLDFWLRGPKGWQVVRRHMLSN